jgi:hypothetical protein
VDFVIGKPLSPVQPNIVVNAAGTYSMGLAADKPGNKTVFLFGLVIVVILFLIKIKKA